MFNLFLIENLCKPRDSCYKTQQCNFIKQSDVELAMFCVDTVLFIIILLLLEYDFEMKVYNFCFETLKLKKLSALSRTTQEIGVKLEAIRVQRQSLGKKS